MERNSESKQSIPYTFNKFLKHKKKKFLKNKDPPQKKTD